MCLRRSHQYGKKLLLRCSGDYANCCCKKEYTRWCDVINADQDLKSKTNGSAVEKNEVILVRDDEQVAASHDEITAVNQEGEGTIARASGKLQ
jgi:hypothetical protein